MAYDGTKPSMTDADWPTFAANIRENLRAIVEGDAGVFTRAADFTLQVSGTTSTSFARLAARSGNGTTSSRKSYLRVETLETAPQVWHAGMLGSRNFVIRDETAALDRIIIDQATGRVGIGTSSQPIVNRFEVYDSASMFTARSSMGVYDTDSMGAGKGGGIALGGRYNSAGAFTAWAVITAPKDNNTDGDASGGLALCTRESTGVGSLQRLFIDRLGNVVMGTGALATNATSGFFYANSSAGPPTGIPAVHAGRVPIHYDTTNNRLYAYNGGWKSVTLV